MIHTARQSPKFKMFVRAIRSKAQNPIMSVEAVAVSILELLWHQTTVGAKQGDIGKFDDELIAEECGWMGDAKWLIQTLIECGYLDETEGKERLLVHDWHEHAPNHVKGVMVKREKRGELGFLTRVTNQGDPPRSATLSTEPPNQLKPNQLKPTTTVASDLVDSSSGSRPNFASQSSTMPWDQFDEAHARVIANRFLRCRKPKLEQELGPEMIWQIACISSLLEPEFAPTLLSNLRNKAKRPKVYAEAAMRDTLKERGWSWLTERERVPEMPSMSKKDAVV